MYCCGDRLSSPYHNTKALNSIQSLINNLQNKQSENLFCMI